MAKLVNRTHYLLYSFLLFSCVSTDSVVNSEKVYVNMKMDLFCDAVLSTYLNDDPCRGGKKYFASKNAIILFSSTPTKYFVFTDVDDLNIDIFNNSYSELKLITPSYKEAVFYINNIL